MNYVTSKRNRALVQARELGYGVDNDGTCLRPDKSLQTVHVDSRGYYRFSLHLGAKSFPVHIHRLAALQRFGEEALFAPGVQVRHLDNDRLNNSAANLALGSQRQNSADNPRNVNKRRCDASADKCRAFTDAEAIEVVQRVNSGEPQKSVAQSFGVSKTTISAICRGARYSEVTGVPLATPRYRRSDCRKLSDQQVLEIRTIYRDDPSISMAELGTRFGVTHQTVSRILHGLLYANQQLENLVEGASLTWDGRAA